MKKIVLCFVFSLLLIGCEKDEYEPPQERTTVHIEKHSNGLAYEQNQNKPFTGIFEGYYRNGYKKAEIHFKNGKQHGTAKLWHENGQQSNEANFYEGKLEGLATEWNKDGTKNKDRIFRDGKLIGSMD